MSRGIQWTDAQKQTILSELSEEGFWETELRISNFHALLEILPGEEEVRPEALEQILGFVADLEGLDQKARSALLENAQDSEAEHGMAFYKNFHLGELDDDGFAMCFGQRSREGLGDDDFVAAMNLHRIAFELEDEENFVALDYTLNPEATNYLVVLGMDATGAVQEVTVES